MLRSLLVLLCLAVAACDGATSPPGPLVFGGEEVAPRGDAALAVVDGELVVSGLDGAREGGFEVAGPLERLDVTTRPVALPSAGARFGVVVEDAAGQPLASLVNESVALPGRAPASRLRVDYPEGVPAIRITYRLAGAVVFTTPPLDLVPGGGRLARTASAGETNGRAESVHVIRSSDGRWIVVSDSQASDARGGCAGYVLRPPVALPTETFPNGTLCTDWVEVEPLGGPRAHAARVAVVGAGVGSFTVRSLGTLRVGQH